jgi:hypothetical protein
MKRYWYSAGLVAALLFVQIMLAAHGLEHAFGHGHDSDGDAKVCIECLALSGMQGAPPPAVPPLSVLQAGMEVTCVAVPPAPTFARYRTFLSRAPPILQS